MQRFGVKVCPLVHEITAVDPAALASSRGAAVLRVFCLFGSARYGQWLMMARGEPSATAAVVLWLVTIRGPSSVIQRLPHSDDGARRSKR